VALKIYNYFPLVACGLSIFPRLLYICHSSTLPCGNLSVTHSWLFNFLFYGLPSFGEQCNFKIFSFGVPSFFFGGSLTLT